MSRAAVDHLLAGVNVADDAALDAKWASFKSDKAGGIGAGTLIAAANALGAGINPHPAKPASGVFAAAINPGTSATAPALTGAGLTPKQAEARLRLSSGPAAAFVLRSRPPANRTVECLVRGVLRSTGPAAILGKRYSGKSTVLVDLGLSIATDGPFAGREVMPGFVVVYVTPEDPESVYAMVEAWLRSRGLDPDTFPTRFFVVEERGDLLDPMVSCRLMDAIRKICPAPTRVVVIFDTFTGNLSNASTNDDGPMSRALDIMDGMSRELRAPVVASMHPPKHNLDTVSGSGVIENRLTTLLNLQGGGQRAGLADG